MARMLVITYNGRGDITSAGVQDVQNAATVAQDRYLIGDDGRRRAVADNLALFDLGPAWIDDLLQWWRAGRYYVENGQVYQAANWTPPGG